MLSAVALNYRNYLSRGDEYVAKLRSMISRHLTIPYEFVEVTERDLHRDRVGWFNKLSLLEMFEGEVLYLDLDIVISGSIDHLVELGRTDPSRVWARNDYSYPVSPSSRIVGDGYAGPLMENGREATINSSVMYWRGRKDMTGADELAKVCHGDQGIITRLFWPNGIGLFPNDRIKSWKYDAMEGRGYGDICVFHGAPKPHECHDEWIAANWK